MTITNRDNFSLTPEIETISLSHPKSRQLLSRTHNNRQIANFETHSLFFWKKERNKSPDRSHAACLGASKKQKIREIPERRTNWCIEIKIPTGLHLNVVYTLILTRRIDLLLFSTSQIRIFKGNLSSNINLSLNLNSAPNISCLEARL